MSSTPDIHRTVKFSPYGKPINKSLLTPCRQIGLSRKRKTPSSLSKTILNSSLTSPVTPVNCNESIKSESKECSGNQLNKRSKKDIKENKDRTAKKCLNENFQNILQKETVIVKNQEKALKNVPLNENILTSAKDLAESTKNIQISNKDVKRINEQAPKKCLDKNLPNLQKKKEIEVKPEITFKNDLVNNTNITPHESLVKNIQVASQRSKRIKCTPDRSLRNVKVSLEKLDDEDIKTYNNLPKKNLDQINDEANSSSEEESEEIIKAKKRKPAVLSSDDEDCEGLPDEKMHSKNDVPSQENEDVIREINSKENNSIQNLKSDNVPSQSQEENNESMTLDLQKLSGSSSRSGNSTQGNKKKATKVTVISDDDEDFENITNNKNKLTLARKESVEKKPKSKVEKKRSKGLQATNSSEGDSVAFKQTKSISSVVDDDEDAFTSTPERDQNEKKSLIDKIRTLENEIKGKRKKVEDLRQAQIYKTKHNIEELKNLTNIWREGCVKGLHDLLAKLQMHGPMNMSTLLNNLNIPNKIVKTSLRLELSEEKEDENLLKNNSEDFKASLD